MRITFPYMGNSPPVFKQMLSELGYDVVVPPAPSKRTLDLGTKYAPEFACIPFKILLGSYLEAISLGADTIISTGGVGPCRAGYYGELHRSILDDLGYDVDIIIIEPPLRRPADFLRALKALFRERKAPLWKIPDIFWRAWIKLNAIDQVEKASHNVRPFEINKGETTLVFRECMKELDLARSRKEIDQVTRQSMEKLNAIPQNKFQEPLRVGLIGEIYVVLESFANHDVQVKLEEMGVLVDRSIYLAEWTLNNAFNNREYEVKKAAEPFLSELVGGHGRNSIGETVLYANRGFDGVIQLAPFACIPEIVAKSILPYVSRKLNIPVMTLFLDEQTGEGGIRTRLEAFVDLLYQRRNKKEGQLACADI
ncbi:MAG: acyl-CoA dehydratase activase-related protein [bacterium]|jgi:predicted nucleotide-binding protein (sugar kinase/HSP70/actin superfamily)